MAQAWQSWIAFGVLAAIGGKMLWDAVNGGHITPRTELFGPKVVLALGLATSLDALAAGVTLPLLHAPLALSLVTIGVTTGVLSAIGLSAGRRLGALLGKRLEAGGGLMLMGLAFESVAQKLLVD